MSLDLITPMVIMTCRVHVVQIMYEGLGDTSSINASRTQNQQAQQQ
jgi:hypothetical protein